MDILTILSGLKPDQIALGAIVTVIIVLVLVGRLVPVSVMNARLADKDKQIAGLREERATLIEAGGIKDQIISEQSKQISGLVEGGHTTTRLLDTIRETVQRNSDTYERRQIEGSS